MSSRVSATIMELKEVNLLQARNTSPATLTTIITILGRNADESGKTYWRNQIIKGTTYDAVTAPRVGFFQSPEYIEKAVSDEQYIKDAYNSFLNRDPEPAGLEYWKNELATGKNYNRQTMLDVGFGNSDEYKQILESYGFGVTETWK